MTHIVIEGTDGSGKTTLASSLTRRIHRATGVLPLSIKEPQEARGTIGYEIRRRLRDGPRLEPWEAVGLFKADRIQQLTTVLRPALEAGRVVIQDRSFLSTSVYNGCWSHAQGPHPGARHTKPPDGESKEHKERRAAERRREIETRRWPDPLSNALWPGPEFLLHHHHDLLPTPDMTVLLDVSGREAIKRLITRALKAGLPLWDDEQIHDLETWKRRYDSLVKAHPGWWGTLMRVDASQGAKAVSAEVWVAVSRMLAKKVIS